MIVPGFEPKKMNDDELNRKTSELQGKLVFAYSMGSYGMVDQMQAMLEALQYEQQERMMIKLHEMQQRMFKDVIESEPDLREKKEVETKSKKSGGQGGKFATFFPPKTKKPGEQPGHTVDPLSGTTKTPKS